MSHKSCYKNWKKLGRIGYAKWHKKIRKNWKIEKRTQKNHVKIGSKVKNVLKKLEKIGKKELAHSAGSLARYPLLTVWIPFFTSIRTL